MTDTQLESLYDAITYLELANYQINRLPEPLMESLGVDAPNPKALKDILQRLITYAQSLDDELAIADDAPF